ncbi:uncharacterized protein [Physcomitrium patens]|uniref:Protein MIS12 homolog n=1 Tax=Physcomitrium patens TaxID=3218 RepID=A0A2K1L1E3_PHYPA|nr:protein MIS12 homolog isoform X2 [Physcomitrium patens]XP_024369115.1 protein MIS12 homolog isoform X2 [Physcomitrium patens]XP_024369116.1 protein MIS12 homolog isoform X2 [Physcomitrium patens]PNR59850.1 hypothetical protein PHYPA_002642 [Physcomitrium patens]|eukprot:XP_024369114.1 protein MIS12 homolog isoform X2 [Physcomitrella patens]
MEVDTRDKILAMYPVHFLNFDKDAFTADVVNAVIEISMSNFTEMERCATRMLNITSTESQEALQQGLSAVFEKFLSKFIEEDLAPWEAYCREVCFKVPDGMVLPEKLDASVVAMEDADAKLDAELISLRERKATAEKEAAELRRDVKALEALVEAKANFMDAFDQLQNLPLVDDLGNVVRELRKNVEEANALRAQRYQRLFPADTSDAL